MFKESCLLPTLCIYEVEINFFKPNLSKFAAKYLVKFDHSGSSHGNKIVLFLKHFYYIRNIHLLLLKILSVKMYK
uniref:Uncharacterized protein n=1 Tax=Lactococcus lactis subsp. cremoris TaxID=1359 RepID=A0A1V0PDV2_LACLC